MRLCRARAREGDVTAVVLHDPGHASAYAHRVAILRAGRVAAAGPPGEVSNERLLGDAHEHAVEVRSPPRTGTVLVTPKRNL